VSGYSDSGIGVGGAPGGSGDGNGLGDLHCGPAMAAAAKAAVVNKS